MNLDHSLIAGILESRDLSRAIRAGANADLLTDEAVTMWNLIVAHEEKFHEVPDVHFFTELYPPYAHAVPQNAMEVIIYELKTRKLGNDVQGMIRGAMELNAVDPWKAKEYFTTQIDSINTRNQPGNTRAVLGADKTQTLALLDSLAQHGGLIGYSWPWEWMNQRTAGLRPGNLVYLYGREKSRKTFLLVYAALYWWSQGLRVLFFTREMTKDEIIFIAYAMLCGLNIDKYKKGEITQAQRAHIEEMMDLLAADGRFVISDNDQGVPGFRAEIEEVRPHVVLHDFWKAMADDAMGDKVGDESRYVSRTIEMIKQFTMKQQIGTILCGHANREGATSKGKSGTEHAWSDNIIRRVDLSLRVVTDDSQDRSALIINRARGMKQGVGFTLRARLCEGFGQVIENSAAWVADYSEADAQEAPEQKQDKIPEGIPARFDAGSFKDRKNFQRR